MRGRRRRRAVHFRPATDAGLEAASKGRTIARGARASQKVQEARESSIYAVCVVVERWRVREKASRAISGGPVVRQGDDRLGCAESGGF
jgi:hypothetical protein